MEGPELSAALGQIRAAADRLETDPETAPYPLGAWEPPTPTPESLLWALICANASRSYGARPGRVAFSCGPAEDMGGFEVVWPSDFRGGMTMSINMFGEARAGFALLDDRLEPIEGVEYKVSVHHSLVMHAVSGPGGGATFSPSETL